jgi:L-arabinose transport system ATP-binding protein
MSFLEFDKLIIEFPGVKALDDVSFGVEEGSIHAICGENGAGKSTLLKILSGVYQADSGRILLGGAAANYATPHAALETGIAVIYQELHLVPEMTVAENICLGHAPAKFGWINSNSQNETASKLLARVGIEIDPNTKVQTLSIAQRQMVEIAKALSRNAKVIAFDEPTSSLSAREVKRLFEIIADLKQQGKVILYVSHRMEEIFQVCDSVTVLRDGKHVETFTSLKEIDAGVIVNRMVGRSIEDIFGYRPRNPRSEEIEIRNISGEGIAEPTSITLKRGEIVGVFGLVGAGRSELLKAIYGAVPASGEVLIDEIPERPTTPRKSIRRGIMLCPEDRKKEGIISIRSVQENINISVRRNFAKGGFWIADGQETANANHQVKRLGIRTPHLQQSVGLLSGGNQQKCVLARWLSETVKLLLLDEPTRGIDVGAKREIYEIIYGLAEDGVGILLVSSELPEVLGVCDRILVMRQGKIIADIPRSEANSEMVLQLALPISGAA